MNWVGTSYGMLVSRELWAQRSALTWPAGFILLECRGDTSPDPRVMVLVYDEGADESLAGMLVEPAFTRHVDGRVVITDRRVIGPLPPHVDG